MFVRQNLSSGHFGRFAFAIVAVSGTLAVAPVALGPREAPAEAATAGPRTVIGITPWALGGYWVVATDGSAAPIGNANHSYYGGAVVPGSPSSGTFVPLRSPQPATVGIAAFGSTGLWVVAADGGVLPVGAAPFFGSMEGRSLNAPVVAMATATEGYWLVAADGGVFAFGQAGFYGSVPGMLKPGQSLNQPIVGIAAPADGRGYWLVGADGGVFAFGDAQFYGSMGGMSLNKPIVGIAASQGYGIYAPTGYWLVASDGGIFSFNAAFEGSLANTALRAPITGMAANFGGLGYWMVAADGGVFAFGDAPFWGSAG